MDSFKVVIQPSAAAEFLAAPFPFRRQLNERINALKRNPRPIGAQVVDGELYVFSVGDWRLLYEVDDANGQSTILAILAAQIPQRSSSSAGARRIASASRSVQ